VRATATDEDGIYSRPAAGVEKGRERSRPFLRVRYTDRHSTAPRHPDESRDPELRMSTLKALDPDFRQDDGGLGKRSNGTGIEVDAAEVAGA
jgi:hypothetical protein